MILKKTLTLKFAMGNYEMVELFATAEVDTIADRDDLKRDYDVDATDHDAVMGFITETLTEFVEPDVKMVAQTTEKEESFVFPYVDYQKQKKTRKGH